MDVVAHGRVADGCGGTWKGGRWRWWHIEGVEVVAHGRVAHRRVAHGGGGRWKGGRWRWWHIEGVAHGGGGT